MASRPHTALGYTPLAADERRRTRRRATGNPSASPLPEFPQPHTRFEQPWHVKRAAIAKVLQDLRAKRQESDERPVVG